MTYNYIVVGLGNPGDEYEKSRHNIGFMVLDIIGKEGAWEKYHSADALVEKLRVGKQNILLLKPTTFMNKSGNAALVALRKEKVKPEHLIVVHDEIDLPEGVIKIVFGRGSAGHKGVESVQRALKTKNFIRVRVGIAQKTPGGKIKKPKGEEKVLKFIIDAPKKGDETVLKRSVKKAVSALEMIVEEGVVKAMNSVNSK